MPTNRKPPFRIENRGGLLPWAVLDRDGAEVHRFYAADPSVVLSAWNAPHEDDPIQCYTCGRFAPSHRALCPDLRYWADRMPYLSEAEFDRLIPVGEWAYSDEGLGLGARYRRDVAALNNRPMEPEGT